MAIRYGNVGTGTLVSNLAKSAGEAVAAQRAAELAERLAERAEQRKAQQEEFQMRLQTEKQMKMLDYQMELERYRRSKEWDIEKMEIASRLDFQKDEQKRVQKEQEYEMKKKAILDSVEIDDGKKKQLSAALDMEYLGASGLAQQFMKPKTLQEIAAEKAEEQLGAGGVTQQKLPGMGNKDIMFIGNELLEIDLDSGTQIPIEDNKLYRVTDNTGKTGNVTGAELKAKWDTDVVKFHGEAVPAAPNQTARPKVQEELQKKFGLKGGKMAYNISEGVFNDLYQKYLDKSGMTKDTLSYEQFKEEYKKNKTIPLPPEEKKKAEQLKTSYGQFDYLHKRFPNF